MRRIPTVYIGFLENWQKQASNTSEVLKKDNALIFAYLLLFYFKSDIHK